MPKRSPRLYASTQAVVDPLVHLQLSLVDPTVLVVDRWALVWDPVATRMRRMKFKIAYDRILTRLLVLEFQATSIPYTARTLSKAFSPLLQVGFS